MIGKKKSGSGSKSPTVLSLEALRETGWTAQKVEYFNMFAKRRIDLFGFIDILAMREDRPGLLGVQACVTGDILKRVRKAEHENGVRLLLWLKTGNQFEVWGWAKRGERGKAKYFERRRIRFVIDREIKLKALEYETPEIEISPTAQYVKFQE